MCSGNLQAGILGRVYDVDRFSLGLLKQHKNIQLAEGIFMPIDHFLDRWDQPVVISWEEVFICVSPLLGIVKQLQIGVEIFSDNFLDNLSSQRSIAGGGIQAGLRDGSRFRPCNLLHR